MSATDPNATEALKRIAHALERIADELASLPDEPAPAKDDAPPSEENTMNSENRPLTIRAAAEYCGVSVETMRARVSDGTVPAARLGTAIRIRPADLDALFVASPVQGGRQ